jgi:hypothetical protein
MFSEGCFRDPDARWASLLPLLLLTQPNHPLNPPPRTNPTSASAPLPSLQLLNLAAASDSATRASSSENSPGDASGAGADSDGEGWGGAAAASGPPEAAAAAYASVAAAVRRTALGSGSGSGSAPIAQHPAGSLDLPGGGAAGSDALGGGAPDARSEPADCGEAWASEDSRAHETRPGPPPAAPAALLSPGGAAAGEAAAALSGLAGLTQGLFREARGESGPPAPRHQPQRTPTVESEQLHMHIADAGHSPNARLPAVHSHHQQQQQHHQPQMAALPLHFTDLSSDLSGSPLQQRRRGGGGGGGRPAEKAAPAPPQWAGDRPGQSSLFNGVCHKNGR